MGWRRLIALAVLAVGHFWCGGGAESAPPEGYPAFKTYTYAHPRLGYAIVYPQDWLIEVLETSPELLYVTVWIRRVLFVNPQADLSPQGEPVNAVITVETLPNPSLDIDQYVQVYRRMESQDYDNYWDRRVQVIEVKGGKRYLLEEEYEVKGTPIRRLVLFVLSGNSVFQVSATALAAAWEKHLALFEHILASFEVQ